ncbi:hypothetical protein [uncultured Litoreibacter sp.]|uniref:hypothetical protein n=1 Tax=uncultured Litoreibacter sp. TaxID=1392394 RepID=UPI00262AB398|nr:hypothetical protein [uncultured Litoreibacter sp.]
MSDTPPLCLLHIGKTGGSYVRSVLRHNRNRWTRPIKLLRHSATLTNTLESFGDARQLAFTFRCPTARFVSAFYSRRRQGRPTYQYNWSAEEAAAYLWFDTAEELALALSSRDERLKSAAIFAFDAIEHLKSNLATYLISPEALRMSKPQIAACVDLPDLDTHLSAFMARLGVEAFDLPAKPKRHAAPSPAPALSAEAEAALRAHWVEEYALYETAREIAGELGLSG